VKRNGQSADREAANAGVKRIVVLSCRQSLHAVLVAVAVMPAMSCASLSRTTATELSGNYAWVAQAGGWNAEGHLTLDCSSAECTGTLTSPFGSNPITRSSMNSGTLQIVVETTTGIWTIRLDKVGSDLHGTFSYNGAEGTFEAMRVLW
jgi:hypothetical protein